MPAMLLGALIDGPDAGVPERVLDRETVQRMAEGDAGALAAVYDRHAAAVFGLAMRTLQHQPDAETVVQEVFAEAWTRAARYDADRESVAAWLLALARRRVIARLRARGPEGAAGATEPAPGDLPDPAAHRRPLVSAAQAVRLRKALTELPAMARLSIELALFEGLTLAETAGRLDQPVGATRIRIQSGLHRLREALAE